MTQAGQAIGYLRLSLRSENIAQMYRAAWRELLLAGVVGLVCVVGLGTVRQLQFTRAGLSLTRALEGALRGEAVRARRAAQVRPAAVPFCLCHKAPTR